MSISLGSFPQAVSSVLDSISSGISRAQESGGPQALNDVIQSFGSFESSSFSNVAAQDFKDSALAGAAHVQPPDQFFSEQPAVQYGTINSQDLRNKLNETQFSVTDHLKGLISNLQELTKENANLVGDDQQGPPIDASPSQAAISQNAAEMISKIISAMHDMQKSIAANIRG